MIKKTFLCFCVFILSCQSATEFKKESKNKAIRTLDNLSYYQDSKSKLCFAGYNDHYGLKVIANIPCTEEVMKLIKEGEFK